MSLVVGDCVRFLQKRIGTHPSPVDLAICDPPYNFDQKYLDHKDKLDASEYLAWTCDWLAAVHANLSPNGSLWVFIPDEWVSHIDWWTRSALKMYRINWCIWAFTFGQKATRRFTRSHCHVLWFAKTLNYTFSLDAIAVPSARELVYKDKRAAGKKPPDDVWMLLASQLAPHMGPDKDMWLQSRVCGTFKEREPHSPNQLPVPLVERLVLACSKPGDLVLDPFLGSGTTGVVCKQHNRRFLGIDISKECVLKSQERIKNAVSR